MAVLQGMLKALDANDTYHTRSALKSNFKAMFPFFSCDFLDEGNGEYYTDPTEIQKKFSRTDLDSVVEIYFWIPVVSPKVLKEDELLTRIPKSLVSVSRKDGLQPLKCYRITDGGNDSWVKYGIALTPIK